MAISARAEVLINWPALFDRPGRRLNYVVDDLVCMDLSMDGSWLSFERNTSTTVTH